MEVHEEAAEVQEVSPFFQFDQEINVASVVSLAPRYGSEDAQVVGAVTGGDVEDFVPAAPDFVDVHRDGSLP